jgi:hypothetical protein
MEVKGLGQLLAALAAALFIRTITGPGPALLPQAEDTEDQDADEEAGGGGGGVHPVAIRWARITCALKNKRGEVVSRSLLTSATEPSFLSPISGAARTELAHCILFTSHFVRFAFHHLILLH